MQRIVLQAKSIFQLRYIWLFAAMFMFFSPAKATHLVGGSVTYEYQGDVNGKQKYLITLKVYRDCTIPPGQERATEFDRPVMLGIYENWSNKPLFNGNYLQLDLKNENIIDPLNGGSECPNAPKNLCYREGIYQTTVFLPSTNYGYHIQYIRCCRNEMVNVPIEEGQTYYGFIPPTSTLKNTSPSFTDVPVPYICLKDTVNLLNSAIEPDGDSLVFMLAWPYSGANKDMPMPTPPAAFDDPPLIRYNSDYSYLKPFGKDGYASVDPLTGATKVFATKIGKYVIAIDVQEYRNGVLISTTRRDLQILVNNCTANNPPARTSSGGTLATTFYVTGGETLQIPLSYKDDNALTLSASGELVDKNSSISPLGSFSNTTGNKSITTIFTWETKCKYVRSKPYILNVKVIDNGCPSKYINQTYSIYVTPFKGADNISGPSPACQGAPGEIYSVTKKGAGSALAWSVTGGTILQQSGSTITVQWNNVAEGYIKVVEISQYNCLGDTVIRKIQIRPKPAAGFISGTTMPCKKVVSRYEVNPIPGSTYIWTVSGGKTINSGANGKLDVLWDDLDSGEISVVQRTADGCYSDTAKLPVDIRGPVIDRIYGSLSVCPNSRGVDYWVIGRPGSQYFWQVKGGKQSGGGNTDRIKVDWGEKGGGIVRAVEITQEGCISDTISLNVTKDYVLITTPIEGDTSVCEYSNGNKYSVLYTNGSSY
ncbi:MAG: hypothetical protein EOP47_20715, partial [Sphingobacteriaceae bacterium]